MMIGGVFVKELSDGLCWRSGLECDLDGSPVAYNPQDTGLDVLSNAGKPGNWYGLACNPFGIPYVQDQPDSPCPGFFVSTTALQDHARPPQDPFRYVDAEKVPYLVIPPELERAGARLGMLAMVELGGVQSGAIVADIGPRGHIGEGSFALHKALGRDPQRALPRHRLIGIDEPVRCVLLFGTVASPAWTRDLQEMLFKASASFLHWGGTERFYSLLP